MANKKVSRRALFTSIMSLILCCAMLMGTTFAWFTDSVTSGNNIIKSGTLDVEMKYSETLRGEYTDASEGAIFAGGLWEPGYTEVRYIKVENVGNLAFKFKLNIIPTAQDDVDLAEVIDVYFVEGPATDLDRSLLGAKNVGTLAALMNDPDGAAYGKLQAGDEAVYGIALKMQETAGNNYQNRTVGKDGFTVQLLATQDTVESDFFGSDYDKLAAYPGTGIKQPDPNAVAQEVDVMNEADVKIGSVLVPTAALLDVNAPIEAKYDDSTYVGNFTIEAGMEKKVVDVKVSNLNPGNQEPIKAVLYLPMNLNPSTVSLYHYNEPIHCTYDPYTGYVTFETTTFSPFTIVYDAESVYVPPVADESDLPVAEVTEFVVTEDIEWGNYGQWTPNEELEANLEAAYKFKCVETAEEAAVNPYANWYCDFYVKLDRDLGENEIFLGGNYGSFGWIGFHNGDITLAADEEIALLGSVTANPWTYADIASFVNEFVCGVGDVNDALKGAEFTVMLRLTNPENEAQFHNVATINYIFE